jgi:serine/threonine protein kinase
LRYFYAVGGNSWQIMSKGSPLLSPHRGPRLGTRFGPYELRSLIGAGGMGEVYRAYDTVKGRMVAVKLLLPEYAADPSFRERFARESRMVARLQEPHVIPVHDFGAIDGVLFIEMRLVNGGSLKDLLREHRDVKPENVLLTPDGFAYLVDFGIARAAADPGVTATGALIGSCAYMSPERFNGGRIGPHTDIYSLACVLYESLTGEPPFEGGEAQQMSAHTFAPPPRPSIMRRGVGHAFDDVVARGMAKPPAARFSSAGQLARAAAAAAASIGEPAPAPIPVPAPVPAPVPPSRPSRTRRFASAYPSPDDSGFSPYPPPPPPRRSPARKRSGGRMPLVIGGAAALILTVAAILAAISAFGSNRNGPPQAAAPGTGSTASTTKSPSLSGPVQGADGWGFVGESARCDPGNPPAAMIRTAQSLAVVCDKGSGSYYYRGERIRDRAHIELSNAVPSAGGFDVTNPADGVRYEVRPERLRIISNGHVDSSEPALQYATAD